MMNTGPMDASAERHTLEGLLQVAAPFGAPADQLAMLQGMGVPLNMLIRVSVALHRDLAEAILAIPAPLDQILTQMPEEAAERALLGFTLAQVLQHQEVVKSAQHAGWTRLPNSLLGLYAQGHQLTYQAIYTGLVLFHADDPQRWERALEVMNRLPCPGAAAPHYAPVTPSISSIYDTAPMDANRHPFLFFCKHPVS